MMEKFKKPIKFGNYITAFNNTICLDFKPFRLLLGLNKPNTFIVNISNCMHAYNIYPENWKQDGYITYKYYGIVLEFVCIIRLRIHITPIRTKVKNK